MESPLPAGAAAVTPRTRAAYQLWEARAQLERQLGEAESTAAELAWHSVQGCPGCKLLAQKAVYEAALHDAEVNELQSRHDSEVDTLLRKHRDLEQTAQRLLVLNTKILGRLLRTLEPDGPGAEEEDGDLALVREARALCRQAAEVRAAAAAQQQQTPHPVADTSPRFERVVAALEQRTAALGV